MAVVDSFNIPEKMGSEQLEYWILFSIAVANKPAKITERKMESFLGLKKDAENASPFSTVRAMIAAGTLNENVRAQRFGQYTRISRGFREAVELDLSTLSVERLESVFGIGPKTARMIMLYAFPDTDCVPLDTHVLKWLRTLGYDAPKSTPTGKRYRDLEDVFRREAKKRNMTVRELDTRVWNTYARYSGEMPTLALA